MGACGSRPELQLSDDELRILHYVIPVLGLLLTIFTSSKLPKMSTNKYQFIRNSSILVVYVMIMQYIYIRTLLSTKDLCKDKGVHELSLLQVYGAITLMLFVTIFFGAMIYLGLLDIFLKFLRLQQYEKYIMWIICAVLFVGFVFINALMLGTSPAMCPCKE